MKFIEVQAGLGFFLENDRLVIDFTLTTTVWL